MKPGLIFRAFLVFAIATACTKKVGTNPLLAYTDQALLDSCAASNHPYYKNNSSLISKAQGSNSPHGDFKLRFNAIAFKALTDSGKLPRQLAMPEGALVIKDLYRDGQLDQYALMYKHSGAWLWAEIKANGQVLYSVRKDPGVCTGCHNQQGNRDYVLSFEFY
jgi:hypothetical protein